MEITSVCVFCGSRPGANPAYAEAARTLGREVAARGIRLVYGGGSVGLMETVAQSTLDAGGEVLGVITRALVEREVAKTELNELRVVETMHERKAQMADASDGFIMLPGGFGTLDEFFEALTWTQLGIHTKPCGVLDVADYFDPLRSFIDGATTEHFVSGSHRALVQFASSPGELLDLLAGWTPSGATKWLDRGDA